MWQKSYDNSPTLYLVPTPIGNMEDMTFRAVNVLKSVDVIFSEDTRVTKILLLHFEINKKLISLHDHNEEIVKEKVLSYLDNGSSIAIVTDRGTPIISDPGYFLAKYASDKGYNVVGLPGPTALISALIMSGIQPMPFLFYGFLNSKEGKRQKELENLKNINATLILYESPHRIEKTLNDMKNILGNRQISISREISKKYEEVYRGTIEEIQKQLLDIKGEFVIVVSPGKQDENYDNLTIIEHINLFIEMGNTPNEAIKKVAKLRHLNKNEVYKKYHRGD